MKAGSVLRSVASVDVRSARIFSIHSTPPLRDAQKWRKFLILRRKQPMFTQRLSVYAWKQKEFLWKAQTPR